LTESHLTISNKRSEKKSLKVYGGYFTDSSEKEPEDLAGNLEILESFPGFRTQQRAVYARF